MNKRVEAVDWPSFLSDAEKAGALLSAPERTKPKSWEITKAIVQIYAGTPLTVTDLGRILSPQLGRSAVDMRFRLGTRTIYSRLPRGLQEKYPLEELLRRKPEPLSKRVERSSKVNGLASKVFERMAQTGKNAAQALEDSNLKDPRRKILVRQKLREWGLIEKKVVLARADLAVLRDSGIPIDQKRLLASGISLHTLREVQKEDNPPIISLKTLLETANLPYAPTKVETYVRRLKSEGLLNSILHRSKKGNSHYRFLLVEDRDDAISCVKYA